MEDGRIDSEAREKELKKLTVAQKAEAAKLQVVVEKKLKRERNKTRHAFTQQEFVDESEHRSVMFLKLKKNENDAAPAGCAVSAVNEAVPVYLKFRGTINAKAEREKLKEKMEELQISS
ncbi:hypothetical protein ACH5RR_024864 [Cinchona calisaya]|uniref:Uncharacterized protein n=1 Tax=Cinchona calisaya TaxID=153742 RepID=A0ABD2Z239_9GENT